MITEKCRCFFPKACLTITSVQPLMEISDFAWVFGILKRQQNIFLLDPLHPYN